MPDVNTQTNAQPTTTTATKEAKEKNRMCRVTAATQDTLLVAAAGVYPGLTQAELLEKAMRALLGAPQPVVYFKLQDPGLQMETAAMMAEFAEEVATQATAIIRSRLKPSDRDTAKQAAKELSTLVQEIRKAVKTVAEDAEQARKLIEGVTPHLPALNAAGERLTGTASASMLKAKEAEAKDDPTAANRHRQSASDRTAEASAILGVLAAMKAEVAKIDTGK